MKKAFDQTVRDLKREVNKKVLKVPSIEQKVVDATSNEPWGPHGSHLAEIAQATRNYHEYQMIMNVLWKRISDTGKNWRHVYKGLTVLDYLVTHGSERVIDEIKEHAYQISTLSNFQYIDSNGRDQGSNVRKKSQSLVNLVNDKERIQELRQKAQANRDKYRSSFSTGRPGGYGDRYDDDRYGRDEDRYGRDRESGYRDDDRYGRNGEPYGREGDRYSRDSDERYGRDGYRDDDYKGSHGNDDYGSRNGSLYRDRSFDDDDHYSQSGGGRNHDPQDERQLEHRLSGQVGGTPPSYEEATRDRQNLEQEFSDRNGGNVSGASPKAPSAAGASPKAASAAVASPEVASFTAPSDLSNAASVTAAGDVPEPVSFGVGGFDEFDPRGSIAAATPAAPAATGAASLEMDLFGSSLDPLYSLALMPVDPTSAHTETDVPASSSLGTDFGNLQPGENPFGDPPFQAIPDNFQVQQECFAPNASFQSPFWTGAPENQTAAAPNLESATGFDFGGSFGGIDYASTISCDQQNPVANPAVISQEMSFAPGNDDLASLLAPQAGSAVYTPPVPQPAAPEQTAGMLPQQTGLQAPFIPQVSQFMPQTAQVTGLVSQGNPQFKPQAAQFTGLTSQGMPQFTPQAADMTGLSSQGTPQFMPQAAQVSELRSQGTPLAAYPIASTNMQPAQMNFTPQSGTTSLKNTQMNQMNLLSQPGMPAPVSREAVTLMPTMSAAKNPSNDKFQTKSTVWTDTLSRGLVNLNISGPKINPHADIGIDFDSMNRKEKRTEKKDSSAAPVTSTITMGKAMGSGSGMGRAGASGLAHPSNPMMVSAMGMGMGMGGYGGGMNQPMGMGMGMNMGVDMGMGINMGMNQGMPMRPPMGMPPGGPGMPGAGYNPMSGYGSQQPYGGGYR